MISKDRQGNKESLEARREKRPARTACDARPRLAAASAQALVRAAGQRSDFAGEFELD